MLYVTRSVRTGYGISHLSCGNKHYPTDVVARWSSHVSGSMTDRRLTSRPAGTTFTIASSTSQWLTDVRIYTKQINRHNPTAFTLTFRFLSETFARRSLFGSSSGSCHGSDATWQEIGRVCGLVCGCPRPGCVPTVSDRDGNIGVNTVGFLNALYKCFHQRKEYVLLCLTLCRCHQSKAWKWSFPELRGPLSGSNIRFSSCQPETSLHRETTHTGLVHRSVRLFISQAVNAMHQIAWYQRHIGGNSRVYYTIAFKILHLKSSFQYASIIQVRLQKVRVKVNYQGHRVKDMNTATKSHFACYSLHYGHYRCTGCLDNTYMQVT